jgi:hypothetical protein
MEPTGYGMLLYTHARLISNAYDQLWDVIKVKKLFGKIDPARVHEYDERSHFIANHLL